MMLPREKEAQISTDIKKKTNVHVYNHMIFFKLMMMKNNFVDKW